MDRVDTPLWVSPSERYPGMLPDRTDVLVIGGGIAGVSLVHHLQRRRISTVLVERKHLAAGASGRNAGFLLAGVADCYAEAVRIFGREKTHEVWGITSENHDRMLEAVAGSDVGYRRLGSATLASGEEERARLEESSQLMRDDGTEALDSGRGEVAVRAGEQECRAGVVILATNAYTAQLVPQVKIKPTRAQMLASAPVARSVCEVPTYSHSGYRYWRQLRSGEVLVGGWRDTSITTEVGYEDQPTDQIQEHLDRKLEEMTGGAEVTHRWAGIMGFTETGLPLVGPVDGMRNVYLCAGFNGHGLALAFMSAKQVVEML
jgi:glycine/D-amino acid oxidase-like deaminating enzyme